MPLFEKWALTIPTNSGFIKYWNGLQTATVECLNLAVKGLIIWLKYFKLNYTTYFDVTKSKVGGGGRWSAQYNQYSTYISNEAST